MVNKIVWIRFVAVIGLILTIVVGFVGQQFDTAMNYYFPQQPQFDYVWLAICVGLSSYFLLVIIRGRFRLIPWHNNG